MEERSDERDVGDRRAGGIVWAEGTSVTAPKTIFGIKRVQHSCQSALEQVNCLTEAKLLRELCHRHGLVSSIFGELLRSLTFNTNPPATYLSRHERYRHHSYHRRGQRSVRIISSNHPAQLAAAELTSSSPRLSLLLQSPPLPRPSSPERPVPCSTSTTGTARTASSLSIEKHLSCPSPLPSPL